MNRLEIRFGHWILRYRWLIIVANLLLIMIAASGARNLVFTANYRVFFSADNPQLLAFQALQQTYSKSDNILFVLAPKNGQALDQKTLAAAEELTTRSWKTPYSSRVDSVTNFQHTEAEEDDLLVQNLVEDASELTAESLTKTQQVALVEPLLVNRLVAHDAHAMGVNVTILLPGIDETTEVPEVLAYARQLVLSQSSFELNSGMGILTALVIALALITDFLLLPALLMKFEGKEYDQVVNVDSAIDGSRA